MVTVLPGPLLPVMAARWGLRDVQSGAFFAALFMASTVGSIFSPHRLRRNLPLGYSSMTAGVLLLIVAGQTGRSVAGAWAGAHVFRAGGSGHRPVGDGDQSDGRSDGGERSGAGGSGAQNFDRKSLVGDWRGRMSVADCGRRTRGTFAGIAGGAGGGDGGDVRSLAGPVGRGGTGAERSRCVRRCGRRLGFLAFLPLFFSSMWASKPSWAGGSRPMRIDSAA